MFPAESRPLSFAAVLLAVSLCVAVPSSVFAQRRELAANQRAVDVVVLKDGTRLYGAVLSRGKDGSVVMVVQRAWLKQRSPQRYAGVVAEERRQQSEAPQKRLQRLRHWMAERADAKNLLPFLQAERQRLEKLGAGKTTGPAVTRPTQFVRLTIPAEQIRGGFQQPPAHRRIALLAWREGLKRVESRSAIALARELREKGVRADGQPVDLSDRLPKNPLETDRQWAARQAIVEYDYLQRLRFQGTDTVLFRAGGDAVQSPSVFTLFSRLWKSQIDDVLRELDGKRPRKEQQRQAAIKEAIRTAEKEKVRGFRITRVRFSLEKKEVTVEEQFVAKMPDGQWTVVWQHRETIDAARNRPEREKRIKEDQRVQRALQLVKGLGLGARQHQLSLAVRFAAAVQVAQEKADEKFNDFRNAYSRRLDTPPIMWRE